MMDRPTKCQPRKSCSQQNHNHKSCFKKSFLYKTCVINVFGADVRLAMATGVSVLQNTCVKQQFCKKRLPKRDFYKLFKIICVCERSGKEALEKKRAGLTLWM